MASLLRTTTSHLHITRSSFNPQSIPNANIRVRIRAQAQHQRTCECHDQYDIQVPYTSAWRWQKEIVAEKVAMLQGPEEQDFNDTLIILQHPPVYTLGTRSTEANLKFDVNDPSFELHRTERGGEVTFHGPGQLVMYPILNLRWHKMDLHWYLRTLEEVVIGALEKACGIRAHRIDGLTGVWVDNQKVAAVGVRVTRWIAYHGVAVNVTTDLTHFSNIVPCGIADYSVTSVAKVLENTSGRLEMSPEGLLKLVHDCLLAEFEKHFDVHLVAPSQPGPEPASANLEGQSDSFLLNPRRQSPLAFLLQKVDEVLEFAAGIV